MAKVQVKDLAKQMSVSAKDLIFKLQSLGVTVDDPSSLIDLEGVMAILSGKKAATRPRNVIMREDKPEAGGPQKKREVRPPRPIVAPPRRTKAAVTEEPAAAAPPTGPVIAEFVAAAEAEAAQQEEAAKHVSEKPPKVAKAKAEPTVAAIEKAAATVEAPQEPSAVEPAAAATSQAPAAPVAHPSRPASPATHERPAAAGPAGARRIGPTGPRARAAAAGPRPNYQGQVVQPPPGYRPRTEGTGNTGAPTGRPSAPPSRPAGPGTRPDMRTSSGPGTRPSGGPPRPGFGGPPRPGFGGGPGGRPSGPGGPGGRPGMGGRPGPGGRMGTPPPSGPPPPTGLAARRRKPGGEEERPEKKKTTGKRGKRSVAMNEEDTELFKKGPFAASTVLDDDAVAPEIAARTSEGESEPARKHAPSSRRDARKQAAPITGKVLDFKRPTGKVTLSEGVTVKELADKLEVKANDLLKHLLMKRGLMVSINQPLGADLALEVAKDLGIDADLVSFETALELENIERAAVGESGAATTPRGPVITVMGHVDHGKTSLLDVIRESNVAEGEAGGITQHIGAYQVEKRDRKIVFLDTPGHEAFTMMRARGAKATDIVVLVVAADDGVMPQTKEAIDHARAANVPMIVAINKIDKPNANPDKVRRELSEVGVLVEQWGGDVVSVEVSAKKKQGIDELLEMIVLTSDLLELKASPEMPARGVVLEAKKDVGRGIVATVLVQDGTLKIGDAFFSGIASGRVRAMNDYRGERIKEAPPSTPVSVTGFDEVPNAGDTFLIVDEESRARMIGGMRQEKARDALVQKSRMSLDQLFQKMQSGALKELNLIIKADVQGSVEVLNDTLRKLSQEQVKVNILHASVGAISTNDILLASASDAIVVGFNVRPERNATELAEKEGVDIRLHTVIYELQDQIRQAMTGLLDPKFQEVFQGRAEVRNTFKVPKIGTIAGCMVTEGTITRASGVRLLRDNRVIHEGKVGSLRHFKNDVSEVRTGFECGIGFEKFQDLKVGDVIEAFRIEKVATVLQ